MKKFLIFLSSFFALLIAAIIILPIIFKDDIQKAIDTAIDENINANVYYDIDGIKISLIKSFPDLTVTLRDFGISGLEEFKEDTLVDVGAFSLTLDLMSVINGESLVVEKLYLKEPQIFVRVLQDGKANYDIAKEGEPTQETETAETSNSDLKVSINHWEITNGSVVYYDESMNFFTTLFGLNHEGNGDFTLNVFDLRTTTSIDNLGLGFEGVDYISDKKLNANVNLNMNLDLMKFTFLDNSISLNDFKIGAEGSISMPEDNIDMDISFSGKEIGLKSILSLIPGVYQEYLEGVDASGEIGFDGFVKGSYNENSMPKVGASLTVDHGDIRYEEYPIPMEGITIRSNFDYPSSDLSETSFNIEEFKMLVDGEELSAYLYFKNLVDYNWDFGFEGNVDFEKITRIFPVENIDLKGRLNGRLETKGKMSDIEAEQYDQMPTSGGITIINFAYVSPLLPQGFEISSADLTFDPSKISLNRFESKSGTSDFNLKGTINNYIGFALGENEILKGNLDFTSSLVNVTELMPEVEEESEVETTEDTTSLEVVKIPENIDFTFSSSIKKLSYNSLDITDFKGNILVKNGTIFLEETGFDLLGGKFGLIGSYSTQNIEKPAYSLGFHIENLAIEKAANSFETIKSYAPIAGRTNGLFSSEFNVNGILGSDMMPIMDAINLNGLLNIQEASIEGGQFVSQLSEATNMLGSSQGKTSVTLKDALIKTEIKDGRLSIEPFDLSIGGYTSTLSGSNGLDGSLDYEMLVQDIPTGSVGKTLNSAIGSYFGSSDLIPENVNLNLGVIGNYDDPKVKVLGSSKSDGSSATKSASDEAKKQAEEELKKQREIAEQEIEAQKKKAEEELEKQKQKAEEEAKEAQKKAEEEAKKAADEAKRKAEEEAKKAEEELKKKAKNFFKKGGG